MMERDELFERVRAAKCYSSTITNPERQKEVELAAFMSIFHPDHELAKAPPYRLRQVLGHK